jgi:hypothetical protein
LRNKKEKGENQWNIDEGKFLLTHAFEKPIDLSCSKGALPLYTFSCDSDSWKHPAHQSDRPGFLRAVTSQKKKKNDKLTDLFLVSQVRCDAASLGVPCTNCVAFAIECRIPTPKRKKNQQPRNKDNNGYVAAKGNH